MHSHAEQQVEYEPLTGERKDFYEEMGYACLAEYRGQIVGLRQFMFTVAICVGIDESGYDHRYCYEHAGKALVAMIEWIVSGDDEPKEYIVRKPELHH